MKADKMILLHDQMKMLNKQILAVKKAGLHFPAVFIVARNKKVGATKFALLIT